MTTTPVIIYVRFSSPQQERGSSIERQLELARAHIEREGWAEVEVVIDKGRSAWKGDHLSKGNLGDLTRRILAGEVAQGTIILVEKLDRLSRQDRRKARRWLEDVTDLGIGVATVDGGRLYTKQTLQKNMVEDIEILIGAELAWKESQQKSERILDALARNRAAAAATGAVMTARCPGWLRVKDGKFEEIEDRCDLVRQIYRWTADGVGARTIAKRLNAVPIPTWGRAKGWSPTYIAEIIASPAVEGDHQPTRLIDGRKTATFEKITNYYPRIVDAELVNRAREGRRMRVRSGGGHRLGFANLFQGVVRCAECGSPMTLRNGPTPRASLICSQVYRGMGCAQGTSIRFKAFENAALDKMLHLALDDRFFSKPSETLAIANKVAELAKLIDDQQTKSNRLLNLILATDEPNAAMVAKQDELERLISDTKGRLARATAELEKAKGAVDQQTHMRRVLEMRQAIDHSDEAIRQPARMKVAQAIQSVVTFIECNTRDDWRGQSEKTYTMALAGGAQAFKFDDKGNILAEIDLHEQLTTGADPERLALGLTGYDVSEQARFTAYMRRRAA
jgi:DNA invertase Pin-like site-specific DNA recombinase